jgi:hypothetical protein
MAEDKKAVIVYADWIENFETLSDEEAGRLIKHFFMYVNDLKPTPIDRITELSFIPLKQALKRDLEKWHLTLEGRSLAGKASAEARRLKKLNEQALTNSTSVESVEKNPTNPTDSVNVNVNVIDKDIKQVVIGEKPKLPINNFSKEKRLLDAKVKFKDEIRLYKEKYSKEMLTAFYEYWTEANSSKSKMLFEMQKTFDVNLRLSRWSKNEKGGFASKNEPNKKLAL